MTVKAKRQVLRFLPAGSKRSAAYFFMFVLILSGCRQDNPGETTGPDKRALDEGHPFLSYVTNVHPVYRYDLEKTIQGDGYRAFVIRMVSQQWLTEDVVDETIWWHWLTIVVPDDVDHGTGLLWIGGGSKNSALPSSVNPIVLEAALATRSVTAEVHNVPFQPLGFAKDHRERLTEDALIAYGWRKFMEGGAHDEDAVWLSRLPMTTVAVRAMDTITDFLSTENDLTVDRYVVAGGSKRGWTTWTAAIFDDRVVAIAPAVIDLLNLIPSFEHHWQALGEWSPAIKDYVNEGIMDWKDTPEYRRLLEIVDPYSYLDYLDMPKFLINASGDEFFLPDSWQFYWDDLKGEKHIRYVPNTGHSLSETDAGLSLIAFYHQILNYHARPGFRWDIDDNGIHVAFDPALSPDRMRLWEVHNKEDRDFRIYVTGPEWTYTDIPIPDDGLLTIPIEAPENGFKAWFVEAEYDVGAAYPFKVTSGVVVRPDVYPYPPYEAVPPKGVASPDRSGL